MNLAKLRQARGWSQRDLADVIGVNQSTIQRAEACDKTAKLATYKACAEALGVSLSDIFSDERSPVENALLSQFRTIPADQQDKVLAILDLVRGEHPAQGQETE